MSDDTPKTVVQALAAVMAELPAIGKGDKSPEGYTYRGVEAITKQLQPLLAKYGVVIVPRAEILATVPSPAMKDGWQDVTMRVEWAVYGPDGSHIEATTNGIGRDRSDKGSNKAQTQAFKYLLLHLLCISDAKDDADGHTYEHDRTDPAALATSELTAKDAKGLLLEHVQGDKALATAAWTAAGLDGLWRVTADQVDKAKAEADASRGAFGMSEPAAGEVAELSSSDSAPDPEPVGAATELRQKAKQMADQAAGEGS